jgi:acetyl-CoA synthase
MALGANQFGFPLIADTVVDATALGMAPDQFFAAPFDAIDGKDESEKAERLVGKCLELRGLKAKVYNVGLPVAYGPAFASQTIHDADLQVEFGGAGCTAFELVQKAEPAEITDGKVELIGPEPATDAARTDMDLGIIVKLTGARVKPDFENYLEGQMHDFINYAEGIEHIGKQDRVAIRVSKGAAAKGFTLEILGKLLCTRFHDHFGSAVQSVQVALVTDPGLHAEWLAKARAVYAARRERIARITDDQVDLFFACTHCRTFAPNNVSIITPEHVSPCGECSWFDARASFELDPAAGRRPLKPGKLLDGKKGIWEGTNQYAKVASGGRTSEVALYSLMQNPMGACGDFECMVMLIPEVNGVMVLSHEDATLPTPAGITIETFSSLTAGEQIPGIVGIGRSFLLSPKFILPEGGFKRVVWMSSRLKESLKDELQAVCEREGEPDLMNKIADEHHVATAEQLVQWLKQHDHPALQMEKMF